MLIYDQLGVLRGYDELFYYFPRELRFCELIFIDNQGT